MGPNEPVQLYVCHPTLLPSILVNRLWAEAGTSILWKRYPQLSALESMHPARKQFYANKVQKAYLFGPDHYDLTYLNHLSWPNLKSLELEVNWDTHKDSLKRMLHRGLEHVEFNPTNCAFISHSSIKQIIKPCTNIRSISIGPDGDNSGFPVELPVLAKALDGKPNIASIRICHANFIDQNLFVRHWSRNANITELELTLRFTSTSELPCFSVDPPQPFFQSLKNLHIVCYPNVALALPRRLPLLEKAKFQIMLHSRRSGDVANLTIMDDVLATLTNCAYLQELMVIVDSTEFDFRPRSRLPTLSGTSLINLAESCNSLQSLTLAAPEPIAIDGTDITEIEFAEFCELAPKLTQLDIELHPLSATHLEESALMSLAKHCPLLEVLRLTIVLRLPRFCTDPGFVIDDSSGHERKLFPLLKRLAFARPNSIYSLAGKSYAASTQAPTELLEHWARALPLHFPHLDTLEAWGDWSGEDSDVVCYYLPLDEPMKTIWDFFSGVEQSLWTHDIDGEGEVIEDEGEVLEDEDFYVGDRQVCIGGPSGAYWGGASSTDESPTQDQDVSSDSPSPYDPMSEDEAADAYTLGYTEDFDAFEDEPRGRYTAGRRGRY